MTTQPNIQLQRPDVRFADEYQAFVRESIAADGGYPWNNAELALNDFAAFVAELSDEAAGRNLPDGVPPQQTYFIVLDDAVVVGELRYRRDIDPPYEVHNGHIGCNVRPNQRGQGYGTLALRLALDIARQDGLDGVLLPIEGDNAPSVRVVSKHGGTLQKVVAGDQPVYCYWVDLR